MDMDMGHGHGHGTWYAVCSVELTAKHAGLPARAASRTTSNGGSLALESIAQPVAHLVDAHLLEVLLGQVEDDVALPP